jgi:hypothetical protein
MTEFLSSPAVEVLSLRRHEGTMAFVKLTRLPGFSRIKLLHGNLIGCLMKDDTSIPHLVDWRTKDSYSLADLPDVNVRMTFMNTAIRSLTKLVRGLSVL